MEAVELARLSDNRIAWTYTDNDGNNWRVAAVKAYTDQNKLGGDVWNGTEPPRPSNYKMRRLSVRTATGVTRVVPLYDGAAPLATPGATINLNLGADSASFVSSGNSIPEQHLIHNVTQQST